MIAFANSAGERSVLGVPHLTIRSIANNPEMDKR